MYDNTKPWTDICQGFKRLRSNAAIDPMVITHGSSNFVRPVTMSDPHDTPVRISEASRASLTEEAGATCHEHSPRQVREGLSHQ